VKVDLQPTTVILSPRIDNNTDSAGDGVQRQISLIESGRCIAFEVESMLISTDNEHHPLPYVVEVRPTPEFSYEGGLNKLLSLSVRLEDEGKVEFLVPGDAALFDEDISPQDLGLTRRRGKILQLSARIDLDNKVSIACAGAVIGYLQRKRSAQYLPNDPDAHTVWCIKHFEMFSLRGTMCVCF
jgi:DNA mismatch repair protein MSH5